MKYPWDINEKIDEKEMTNIIYDTLMGNKGKVYPQFDPNKVKEQEVDAGTGIISFEYDGSYFIVKVDQVT